MESLLNDKESGSQEILRRLICILLNDSNDDDHLPLIQQTKDAFPFMAILTSFEAAYAKSDASTRRSFLQSYLEQLTATGTILASKLPINHITSCDLLSNSSTVIDVVCTLPHLKRLVQAESRPAMEGVLQARKLASLLPTTSAAAVEITLVTDASLARYVHDVDCAIIGADCYDDEFIVNKTGSLALCLIMQHFKKPVYCVCSQSKRVDRVKDLHIDDKDNHDPSEVLNDYDQLPSLISLRNPYFEMIPRTLLQLITTNK